MVRTMIGSFHIGEVADYCLDSVTKAVRTLILQSKSIVANYLMKVKGCNQFDVMIIASFNNHFELHIFEIE